MSTLAELTRVTGGRLHLGDLLGDPGRFSLRAGRYYLVRNAGHLLQEEAPTKLLEIIYSYIPPAVPSYDVYRYTQNLAEDQE